MNDERRESHRSVVKVPFKVTHDSFGTLTVSSRDLSVGGIFALHDTEHEIPEPGSIIDVSVMGVPGTGLQQIQAEVVRVGDGGFGLRFLYADFDEEGEQE